MAILTKPSALGLRIIKLLEGLPEERLQSLALQCKWRRYEPEQLIISRDGADRDVHLIVSGKVRITIYSANGRQVTFNDEGAGSVFGELAAIDGKMPGNHDDRERLREAFADHPWLAPAVRTSDGKAPIQYAVRVGPLHLLTLDTAVPGHSHGELCDARLDWLEAALAGRVREPVIVAMHHPPFTTLIGHMDKIGLMSGIDRLGGILARHPNVERVICGHLHRSIDVRFGGTIASTCPGPAHQVTLDLDPDAASTFTMEPPGFRIHAWTAATGVVTHLAASGRFEGPYPFHEEAGGLID